MGFLPIVLAEARALTAKYFPQDAGSIHAGCLARVVADRKRLLLPVYFMNQFELVQKNASI